MKPISDKMMYTMDHGHVQSKSLKTVLESLTQYNWLQKYFEKNSRVAIGKF